MTFINPVTDSDMEYDLNTHRYVLTEEFVRDNGIDLSLMLDAEHMPEPSKAAKIYLQHLSFLVYSNIYSYGRTKDDKEYLLACSSELRPVIRDAMMERIHYMYNSGDLSSKAGAIIENGTRVETQDLIASPIEEDILRTAGLLHRGEYFIMKDDSLVY